MDRVNEKAEADGTRLRSLSNGWRALFRIATVGVVLLAVNQAFNFNFFVGYALIETRYLYALLGFILPMIFLFYPHREGARRDQIPWFDFVLAAASVAAVVYFIIHAVTILDLGWEMGAPMDATIIGAVLWLLVIEAARRSGGFSLAVIVAVFSLYPVYAGQLPGPIAGFSSGIDVTAAYHAMSGESILGIPLNTFGQLVIGFLIFGAALQHTGAGKFFLNFAFAILGQVRGGPAKVAIFASGLMGSMSGSVITNVITTGTMTIPAMRRIGLTPAFAGGVETCASTGGVLMPPVMGTTAFIMANFLGVPYADVAIAAVLPSLLFYYGLFVQIDTRAAREGIKGLPRAELPSLKQTLREGWYYLFAFALLIFMLLVLKREVLAPYYTTPLLLLINQIVPTDTRWKWRNLLRFIDALGQMFTELVAILAGVGLIIGALSVTGLAGTLVNDLLSIAGGSPFLLLVMGAVASFILGVGMTCTAAYVFLAILLVPALTQVGINPMASHLFILYWGMLSFITPPVALGAFAAASIAKAHPMRTGFEAMRLGSIIYFIPFFFVFDPAFILQGAWSDMLVVFGFALLGTFFLAGGLQGYVQGVGNIFMGRRYEWPARVAIMAGGIALASPGHGAFPWTKVEMVIFACILLVPVLGLASLANRRGKAMPEGRLA
ncbi:TRAP transporter permease [Shumkonia mesophila]|uniref:TRAP transporter permease n=1 Tax=Shumkonia mesophila TaxID=2838854 RepID=UPI0029340FBB|nr:TRAP transporter permease [Shumkonia mesophila]